MERTRAIEIIEAYGGYPAAWPDDERAAAEALVARDAALAAMVKDARAIDRVLRDWACALVPATEADADTAARAALASLRPAPVVPRWLPRAAAGGLLAASVAIGAILLARPDALPTPLGQPAHVEIAFAALPGEDAEAAQDMLVWGSVFTPTPAEETVL
jgi:hypothetical protein